MFIDAVCIYGETKPFSVTLYTVKDPEDSETPYIEYRGEKFVPLDLSDYSVRFKILGSATADAEVMAEHLITQVSNIETEGQITDATSGEFAFVVTEEDTRKVGLGHHPIMLELVDVDTLEHAFTITEGGKNGEFNKVHIVQV